MTPTEQIERLRELHRKAHAHKQGINSPAATDLDIALWHMLPALLDVAEAAAWLMADTDDLDRIDKGFEKLDAALSRLVEEQ